MKAYKSMLINEMKLSLRGMDMVIFAVCLPLVVLTIIGIIYGDKPAFEGATYTFLDQSFGGICTIAICAGGVMGLPLVISDYREKQILKRFKVTPVKPIVILLVQVTIYAIYSATSLITLFIVAKLFFGLNIKGSILEFIIGWIFVMISMFSIGMMVGGIAKNTKLAGVIASVLYFPMLIFSGATLPYEVMPSAMQKVVSILPLTQSIKFLKSVVLGLPASDMIIPIFFMIVIMGACIFVSIKFFRWE